MKEINFSGCSDYVEVFWNATDGDFKPDVIYQHIVTEDDVARFWKLKAGQTVHMMASKVSLRRDTERELYIVTEAVTDNFDDSELNTKVAKLRETGALYVYCSRRGRTSAETYEALCYSWGIGEPIVNSPCNEIGRLNLAQSVKEALRSVNEEFVANARVFTADELKIIDNYRKAEEAYTAIFKR